MSILEGKKIAIGAAGMLFGAALTLSGVYQQIVIISQMKLVDFHMLRVFLVASGGSAIIMASLERLGLYQRRPPQPATINLFSLYDANIIGGLMVGVSMSLTGACPGTILIQTATGISKDGFIMAGALLGGFVSARFAPYLPWRQKVASRIPQDEHTLHRLLRLSPTQALFAFEVLCLAGVGLAPMFETDPHQPSRHPIIGGLLIAGAQTASLLMTGSAVGISMAFEELGRYFWRFTTSPGRSSSTDKPLPSGRALTFAIGVLAGGWVIGMLAPIPMNQGGENVSSASAFLGGVLMIMGAITAGGCTSGHGISGMATLSVSSAITVASIFAGGIVHALLWH